MAVLLAAWPFSGMSFNDDWTWAYTVKRLNETGHLTYNGWSSPSVIAQAYWGLLWVKVFGFSFNVLRISSLPLAAGAVALTYLLARRVGLLPNLAVFVSLMLGLSPVFMPMACSFMTDVPGLFFILLSMYALLRGFEARANRAAIAWLVFGAVIGLVGGSSRQVVWIVPLVVLPYLAWIRRESRLFVATAAGSLAMVFIGAIWMQHWFAQQPYSIPDPPSSAYLIYSMHHPVHLTMGMVYVTLTLTMLLLPASLLILRKGNQPHLLLSVCIFTLLALQLWHVHKWIFPWLGNIVTSTGTLGSISLAGNRPYVIPMAVRELVSIVVFAIVSIAVAMAVLRMAERRHGALTAVWDYFLSPARQSTGLRAILLTCLALVVLEMTRAVFDVAFDRHLMPLIPLLGMLLLVHFQRHGLVRMPIMSWAVLGVFAIYAFGFTQELNSLARARVAAVDRLKAAGD